MLRAREHPAGGPTHRLRAKALALLATALIATGVVSGCGGDGDKGSSGPTGPPDVAAGEQVYGDRCAACHGRDFQGSAQAPSHLDAHFKAETTSDADYRKAIRDGADVPELDYSAMPALNLDDQEIVDVIAYIRSVQQDRGFNKDS